MNQFQDLRSSLAGHGDLELCANFKSFEIPIDNWASLTKEKRDRHFKRFMRKSWMVNQRTVTTSNGAVAFTGPGKNGGKKPGQKRRRKMAKTLTKTKKK